MITEPLLLLCKIGILERIRPAIHAHIKASAVYRFAPPYRKDRIRLEIDLPPKLTSKLRSVDHRRETRLNRKFPWREKLLADLLTINFSASARPIIAAGILGKSGENLKRLVSAVDGQAHFFASCVVRQRAITNGCIASACGVSRQRVSPVSRVVTAHCVAWEREVTVGRVAVAGCVGVECTKPHGRVVAACRWRLATGGTRASKSERTRSSVLRTGCVAKECTDARRRVGACGSVVLEGINTGGRVGAASCVASR